MNKRKGSYSISTVNNVHNETFFLFVTCLFASGSICSWARELIVLEVDVMN